MELGMWSCSVPELGEGLLEPFDDTRSRRLARGISFEGWRGTAYTFAAAQY